MFLQKWGKTAIHTTIFCKSRQCINHVFLHQWPKFVSVSNSEVGLYSNMNTNMDLASYKDPFDFVILASHVYRACWITDVCLLHLQGGADPGLSAPLGRHWRCPFHMHGFASKCHMRSAAFRCVLFENSQASSPKKGSSIVKLLNENLCSCHSCSLPQCLWTPLGSHALMHLLYW